jgi:hypothetical protein
LVYLLTSEDAFFDEEKLGRGDPAFVVAELIVTLWVEALYGPPVLVGRLDASLVQGDGDRVREALPVLRLALGLAMAPASGEPPRSWIPVTRILLP